MQFSPELIEALASYVYALIDPRDKKVFYIGKGEGARMLDHVAEAETSEGRSEKLERIKDIQASGYEVEYAILRHGLSSKEAFTVESTLIDFIRYFGSDLVNIVAGHHTHAFGIKTADELIRQYDAPPLEVIASDCVMININRRYNEARGEKSIYEVTRGSWVMANPNSRSIKFVLSEYRGFVVEVFEVTRWKQDLDNKRWSFEGKVAHDSVRKGYINRKIYKARGTANPIAYKLQERPPKSEC